MSSKMILDAIGFEPAKGTSFGEAVQDLSELSYVSKFEDKQIRLVENEGLMYRFDHHAFTVADGIGVIRPSTIGAEVPGRWFVLKPVVDHSTISNLSADDHPQYVHKDIARLISAAHTFNPATAGVAFILGANAIDQKIVGLNADKLDGLDSTAFVRLATAATITAKHSFSPAVADVPFILGTNAQGQKVIGLNADQLDGIDSTAFIQKASAGTITVAHTISPAVAGVPFILGANAQGQKVIGLNADQLDGIDSTAFLQKGVTGIITVAYTFNPSVAGVPFVIGANAIGQKVIGLNADQLDGFDSVDFVHTDTVGVANGIASLDANGNLVQSQLAALANGMPAYVEPNSGVLISMTTIGVNFALVTNGTRNVYLNNLGDIASNILGFILPRNAVLVSVVASVSVNLGATATASFQVRRNDLTTPVVSFSLLSSTSRRIFTGQTTQFNAGDEIQCYLSAASNVANPTVFLEFAWRD